MKIFRTTGMTIYDTFDIDKKVEKKKAREEKSGKDTIQISNTAKVFKKVDDLFNLSGPEHLSMEDLSAEERREFVKAVATLLKDKYVGYEVLNINGRPEMHDVVLQLGDERTAHAKPYRGRQSH